MASRAVPVPGPMADQAAMAERGARAAMAERTARAAMADRGAWEASMVGSPPPQKFLGETLLRKVLRRRRRTGFWGAGRNRQGLW